MKKPNTPVDSNVNHRKYSFVSGLSCHEANVPVKTMILDNRSMTTEIPSTPMEYAIFNGLNQGMLYVNSIGAVSPALRI